MLSDRPSINGTLSSGSFDSFGSLVDGRVSLLAFSGCVIVEVKGLDVFWWGLVASMSLNSSPVSFELEQPMLVCRIGAAI
jgi:hypothetical protein